MTAGVLCSRFHMKYMCSNQITYLIPGLIIYHISSDCFSAKNIIYRHFKYIKLIFHLSWHIFFQFVMYVTTWNYDCLFSSDAHFTWERLMKHNVLCLWALYAYIMTVLQIFWDTKPLMRCNVSHAHFNYLFLSTQHYFWKQNMCKID